MKFIDEAVIEVRSGAGGNGCVAFRREAHVPRGGPSGGDGGHGGSVIVRVDPQLQSLADYKYRRHYAANRGEDGRGKDQYGADADNVILPVPEGTLVFDHETGEQLADLTEPGQEILVAKGGAGGLGNIHFKTAWKQAPRESTPGRPGQTRRLRLELKLLADVGIIGLPSVGKSTLIAAVSAARPKIADYPFTTLIPNLGVARLSGSRQLVVADVPGLIEGASEGVGLGHQFLRHIERSAVLIHVVECVPWDDTRDTMTDFDLINRELALHHPDLARKPQIVALNKCDITEVREQEDQLRAQFEQRGVSLITISAAARLGLEELLDKAWQIRQTELTANLSS